MVLTQGGRHPTRNSPTLCKSHSPAESPGHVQSARSHGAKCPSQRPVKDQPKRTGTHFAARRGPFRLVYHLGRAYQESRQPRGNSRQPELGASQSGGDSLSYKCMSGKLRVALSQTMSCAFSAPHFTRAPTGLNLRFLVTITMSLVHRGYSQGLACCEGIGQAYFSTRANKAVPAPAPPPFPLCCTFRPCPGSTRAAKGIEETILQKRLLGILGNAL